MKNKKFVPKLRFPEFRDAGEWEDKQLKQVCKMQAGKFVTASNIYETKASDLYPCYGGNGLRGYTKSYTHSGNYPLIGRQGALCGNVILAQGKFHATEHAVVVSVDDGTSTDWLFYKLIKLNLNQHATGQAQPGLSVENIEKINIRIPKDKVEQQKIADCLSSLDDLITAHTKKLDNLKTHKKGLMQQLFPAEGETVPKLRFPEFREAREWEDTTIAQLIEENILFPPKDGNHGSLHPKSSDYVKIGIPFIMASDIKNNKIDFSNCAYITKELADTLQKGFAKQGDVLLTHKGTVGSVAMIDTFDFPYVMLTPQVTYYRVKRKEVLLNTFLSIFFISDFFQNLLKNVSGGGTRAYIGITEQSNLKIKFPDQIFEQKKIADCLSSLDDLITAQTQKIEALKLHKKGLMQQLFPTIDEVDSE